MFPYQILTSAIGSFEPKLRICRTLFFWKPKSISFGQDCKKSVPLVGGTGKQSDLRGRSVYFLHIPLNFWGEIFDLFLLWYGEAKYILQSWIGGLITVRFDSFTHFLLTLFGLNIRLICSSFSGNPLICWLRRLKLWGPGRLNLMLILKLKIIQAFCRNIETENHQSENLLLRTIQCSDPVDLKDG